MTVYHRPSSATKLFNRFFGWLAGMGVGPRKMVTLEVKGRRSGQVRSAVVNVVEVDGQRYLTAPRGHTEWVRNVRAAGGQAALRHGKREDARLEEVPVGERAPIIKKYLGENAMATKAHFGIEPDAPLEEFERIAAEHPVFRIVSGG